MMPQSETFYVNTISQDQLGIVTKKVSSNLLPIKSDMTTPKISIDCHETEILGTGSNFVDR